MGEHKKDIDDVTGVETTGHEWDGLKELNNPLPRWWLWVWLVCIIFAVAYWFFYPAWPVPGGHTKGLLGYTQFGQLEKSQQDILERQKEYLERFDQADFEEIMSDEELYAFAVAGGSSAFQNNCAVCHGTGAAGGKGYPNLNDDDWLWGGELEDIYITLLHGIRHDNIDTRVSQMPAFGADGLLSKEEIAQVIDHVSYISGQSDKESNAGQEIFAQQCASCHGADGKGLREFGAPNLTDKIWLYGGDRDTLYETIFYARAGVMPAWKERLDNNTIKQLSIYVHELGGGESTEPTNGHSSMEEKDVNDVKEDEKGSHTE